MLLHLIQLNLDACEDFLHIVLSSHVVGAAEFLLQKKEYEKATDLAKHLADQFLHFDPDATVSRLDKVQLYATEVLTLGLL